jgi:hypothetical protein
VGHRALLPGPVLLASTGPVCWPDKLENRPCSLARSLAPEWLPYSGKVCRNRPCPLARSLAGKDVFILALPPHPNPLPKGEGEQTSTHPTPLPKGEGPEVRAIPPISKGRGNSFRHSLFAVFTARRSLFLLFAIRYSLFAIRRSYRSPLAARRSLFLPFAIRHSLFAIRRSYRSPLAARRSPRKPQPLSCSPLPTRSQPPCPGPLDSSPISPDPADGA